MQRLFARLSEKDKRSYAAIESLNTAMAVSGLFGIDPKTVRRGLSDLEAEDDPAPNRSRKKGADGKA